jgi:hypothetical protein
MSLNRIIESDAGCTHAVPTGAVCGLCPRPGEINELRQFAEPPDALNRIADKVLAYRPKDKRKKPRKRKRPKKAKKNG